MEASVFGARLDLVINLIDTTTGAPVDVRNIAILRNGEPVRAEMRGEGTFIFINTGREDFLMLIRAYGYEDYEARISYEELDDHVPVFNAFLMPSESAARGESLVSFSGTLPFLKAIEAVNLSRPVCIANEFNPKEKLLSVFTIGGGLNMGSVYYGLLHSDKMSYEKIEAIDTPTPQSVSLRDAISEEFSTNSPIMRVVFGSVKGNGDYLLRVRDDAEELKYLVRYTVGDEIRFKTVDLRSEDRLV